MRYQPPRAAILWSSGLLRHRPVQPAPKAPSPTGPVWACPGRLTPPSSVPAAVSATGRRALTCWTHVGVPGAARVAVVCPRRYHCCRSPRASISSRRYVVDLRSPPLSLHLSHTVCSPCMLRYIYFCSCLFLFWSNARCVYDVSR
jgi:hypothetical protein